MNNPAFMASAGDDGSSGDGGGSGSAGSTTRPVDTTGDPPPMTTATPTTPTTDGPDPVTTTSPATSGSGGSDSTGIDPVETTGGVEPDTTGPDSSSGDLPPECGNGIVDEGEQCDSGQIEPAPGKCAPDCQAMIVGKRIFAFNAMLKGDFVKPQNADASCQEYAADKGLEGQYKALLSDGETRVGSVQPWDGKATADWPLHPYTAYFNGDQQLVWITLKRPLLGAGHDNEGFPLVNAITADNQYAVWTGLQSDWLSGPNCNKWAGLEGAIAGKPYKLEGFLDAAGYQQCATAWGLICVQQ